MRITDLLPLHAKIDIRKGRILSGARRILVNIEWVVVSGCGDVGNA
jgi:hypothetical protein